MLELESPNLALYSTAGPGEGLQGQSNPPLWHYPQGAGPQRPKIFHTHDVYAPTVVLELY